MKAIFLTLLALSSAINLQAGLVTKPVSYEHNGSKLVGYLAYDDAVTWKGKPPGILVFHEWWGLNDFIKGRTEQLARAGYVAFAADMYGDGQATTDAAKAKELSSQFYGNSLMPEISYSPRRLGSVGCQGFCRCLSESDERRKV
jgi:dienelactone hydrolase